MNARSGVLFDVDGTLVDTAYIHTICWAQALAEAGFHPPMARVHRAVGMGADLLVGHVLGADVDPEVVESVTDGHDRRFEQWYDDVVPLPGARSLLAHCADRGMAVVLASSSNSKDLDAMRRALGADAYVTAATSSQDAEQSKPSPDILSAAIDQAGLDPERTVAVGDSVWDAKAAASLGVEFVGVESGGYSRAELEDAGATHVGADPLALLAEFARTPLARLTS
jgi:HAD superfamily hydrolase (TIGR01509 family)